MSKEGLDDRRGTVDIFQTIYIMKYPITTKRDIIKRYLEMHIRYRTEVSFGKLFRKSYGFFI